MCLCVQMCMCVPVHMTHAPEESTGLSGDGVTGSCEPPDLGAGAELGTQSSPRAGHTHDH